MTKGESGQVNKAGPSKRASSKPLVCLAHQKNKRPQLSNTKAIIFASTQATPSSLIIDDERSDRVVAQPGGLPARK